MNADGTTDDGGELPERKELRGLPANAEVLPPQEEGAVFATGGFEDGPEGPIATVTLSLSTGTVNVSVCLTRADVRELRATLEEAMSDALDTTEAVREADRR